MKKYLLIFIVCINMMISLSSCGVTYATAQEDIYYDTEQYEVKSSVSFDIIIQYGTPYYYQGSILYYLYDGIYYYPYWYNDYWYVRSYSRPFNHLRHRPYFRPSHNDYRFRPGMYHGYNRPHFRPNHPRPYNYGYMNRPNHPRPYNYGYMNRPNHPRPNNHGHMNRPNQPRPNNGSHGNHGHNGLGGRR